MIPSSVYRLQMRGGMDFARAEGLLPYLHRLGAGALYLSPVFTAVPASSHGYDVTDPARSTRRSAGWQGWRRCRARRGGGGWASSSTSCRTTWRSTCRTPG